MENRLQMPPHETAPIEELLHGVILRHSKNSEIDSKGLKESLKSLLINLVENQNPESYMTTHESELVVPDDFTLMGHVKHKIMMVVNQIQKKSNVKSSKIHENGGKENSNAGHSQRNSFERLDQFCKDAHFSEFGGGSVTHRFGKAKRSMDFSNLRSPGPAVYGSKKSGLSNRPAFVFTKSEAPRNNYLKQAPETPSPAEYYPTKRFISN